MCAGASRPVSWSICFRKLRDAAPEHHALLASLPLTANPQPSPPAIGAAPEHHGPGTEPAPEHHAPETEPAPEHHGPETEPVPEHHAPETEPAPEHHALELEQAPEHPIILQAELKTSYNLPHRRRSIPSSRRKNTCAGAIANSMICVWEYVGFVGFYSERS